MEPFDAGYNTILSPVEEDKFRVWKRQYAPHDSGEDYDFRGAYKAGIKPDYRDMLKQRYKERQASPDELSFFTRRPEVAGYAADDKTVVVNPYSDVGKDPIKRNALLFNERIRHHLNDTQEKLTFGLTPEQTRYFQSTEYQIDPAAQQATILARILSGDPSAGPYTPAQDMAAQSVLSRIGSHWPDTYKKPNHPTFSDQSQYADYGVPGRWEGERFIPPSAFARWLATRTPAAQAVIRQNMRSMRPDEAVAYQQSLLHP